MGSEDYKKGSKSSKGKSKCKGLKVRNMLQYNCRKNTGMRGRTEI